MLCRLLLLVLILLFSPGALAQRALQLMPGMERVDLVPYMAWLRDSTGTMTVEWHPLPGSFNPGFTRDAIWLRIEIDRPAEAPQDWLLEVGNADLAHLGLNERAVDGTWHERQLGEDISRSDWDMDYRTPVFRLDLAAPGRHTFWLRVRSRTSMSAQVRLWRPQRFEAAARHESLAYGLLFGAYATIFIFFLFFWRWTREKVSLWYTWYVFNSLGQMVLTFGHLQQYTGIPGRITDGILSLLICSSIWIGVNVCVLFISLPKYMPRTARWLTCSAAWLSAIYSLLAMCIGYATGVVPAQISVLVFILVLVAIAFRLWRHGERQTRVFLLAFGIFFVGVVLRILRNFTFLPPNFLTDNGYQIAAVAHMLVMSLAIAGRYNTIKQEKAQAQAEALRAETEYALSLESEVAARTTSLVDEIGRRTVAELELRQALLAEQKARQEQLDFVAMVSHEFRTPLSIIDTSAQRIASDAGAPEAAQERCSNIRRTIQRMTLLMDEFLSLDRLDSASRSFAPSNVDPEHMIHGIAHEWEQGQITVTCRNLPANFRCDTELLGIALRNLLANAIRHSPEHRPIELSASGRHNDMVIEISDQGSGIPSDEIPMLFQKYFRGRGSRDKPGAGLGLYLAKHIIDLHSGHLSVESTLGKGTTFTIFLPNGASDDLQPSRMLFENPAQGKKCPGCPARDHERSAMSATG